MVVSYRGLLGGKISTNFTSANVGVIGNRPSNLYRKITGDSIRNILTSSPLFQIAILVMIAALVGGIMVSIATVNFQTLGLAFLFPIFGALAIAILYTMRGTSEAFEYLGNADDQVILQSAALYNGLNNDSAVSNLVNGAQNFVANTLSETARLDNVVSAP